MKVTKAKAFVLGLLSILGVYIGTLVVGITTELAPVLTAIVALTSLYIGGNVADNGVKGKFYRSELSEKKE